MASSLPSIFQNTWSVLKAGIDSCVQFFAKRFAPPLAKYEKEIDELVVHAKYAQRLYDMVVGSNSLQEEFDSLKENSQNKQVPNRKRALSCLVLSTLYAKGVGGPPHFCLQKDHTQSQAYHNLALSLLGKGTIDPQLVQEYVDAFQAGSKSAYAYQTLLQQAEEDTIRGLSAQRALYCLFKKGVEQPNFKLDKNLKKAGRYSTAVQILDNRITTLVQKLSVIWGRLPSVMPLFRKLTETGNNYAQLAYGKYLKHNGLERKIYGPFYKKAAEKNKSHIFRNSFGIEAAKKALNADFKKNKNVPLLDRETMDDYQFELSLNPDYKHYQQLGVIVKKQAQQGGRIGQLRAGLYNLVHHDNSLQNIRQAREHLSKALKYGGQMTAREQSLHDRLCAGLAEIYHDFFRLKAKGQWKKISPEALKHIEAAISCWQRIPPDSKYYPDLIRISEAQRVLLNQKEAVIETIIKNRTNDADLVRQAVVVGFENYYDQKKPGLISLLSSKDASKLDEYKKKFLDQSRVRWNSSASLVDAPDVSLKKIIAELVSTNTHRKEAHLNRIHGITRLKNKIFGPNSCAFFKSPALVASAPILQSLSLIILAWNAKTTGQDKTEQEMISRCFFDFAVAVCNNAVSHAISNPNQEDFNILPSYKDSMYVS